MLDRDKFYKMIGFISGLEGCISNKGQRSVLVCGHTGVGISTFINYAGGIRFEQFIYKNMRLNTRIADKSQPLTEVGHSTNSATNHPVIVKLQNNLTLIDLPAFNNNNLGEMEDYFGFMSILFASAFSGDIAGIMMGMDLSKIECPRDNGPSVARYPDCRLLSQLFNLMPSDSPLNEKLIVIGLKKDRLPRDRQEMYFEYCLKEFIEETYDYFLRRSGKPSLTSEMRNQLCACRCVEIDVQDNGASRAKVLPLIQNSPKINLVLNLPVKERIDFESDFKAFLLEACDELSHENIGEKLFLLTNTVCEIMSSGAPLASLDPELGIQIKKFMEIYNRLKFSPTEKPIRASQSSSGNIIESNNEFRQDYMTNNSL